MDVQVEAKLRKTAKLHKSAIRCGTYQELTLRHKHVEQNQLWEK